MDFYSYMLLYVQTQSDHFAQNGIKTQKGQSTGDFVEMIAQNNSNNKI